MAIIRIGHGHAATGQQNSERSAGAAALYDTGSELGSVNVPRAYAIILEWFRLEASLDGHWSGSAQHRTAGWGRTKG